MYVLVGRIVRANDKHLSSIPQDVETAFAGDQGGTHNLLHCLHCSSVRLFILHSPYSILKSSLLLLVLFSPVVYNIAPTIASRQNPELFA